MKTAYMTIDDGPTPFRKEKVDILFSYNIPAVWFSTGREMELHRDMALYTVSKGGILGNHSWSHAAFSKIPLKECYNEILRTDELITDIYREAGMERAPRLFRFPYGDKGGDFNYFSDDTYSEEGFRRKEAIQNMLKELGYSSPSFPGITYSYFSEQGHREDRDISWTYDVAEWNLCVENPQHHIKDLEDIFLLMDIDWPEKWAGLNYPGSEEIILLHDHSETSSVFEEIIQALMKKGLEFKTLPEEGRG